MQLGGRYAICETSRPLNRRIQRKLYTVNKDAEKHYEAISVRTGLLKLSQDREQHCASVHNRVVLTQKDPHSRMWAHTCNPGTREAEAGGSTV